MYPNFQRSALAVLISLFISSNYALSKVQPQPLINLTPEISAKYTGKGVKLGVVDNGFILDHNLLAKSSITPDSARVHTSAFLIPNSVKSTRHRRALSSLLVLLLAL